MRKLLLCNEQSPGDVLMMTAAVRDLHINHPEKYLTDVCTPCPEIWQNNQRLTRMAWRRAKDGEDGPHVTDVTDRSGDVKVRIVLEDKEIEPHYLEYDLIHRSNHAPYHFLHGFTHCLEDILGIRIRMTAFHGDIHLGREEKEWISQVAETGHGGPFWIVVAGGKYDYTAKWWDPARYQKVVDWFQDRVKFVQCGESHGPASDGKHFHPPLRNVIDLRGRTDLRQFIRLIHHSSGVLCPVTFAMHAAAAVPTRDGRNRPCVVVAGGREPAQWEAYPEHQYLHMNGVLDCCDRGGCWRSRCQQVGDGDEKDDHLCSRPVQVTRSLRIAECMHMISAEEVIRRIETYLRGRR